jgi:hypothetical protein
MMAKPEACAEMVCGALRQRSMMTRNVGLERRQRRNTILILIAAPFVALATWFVINVLFELFGSERSYASNFGVSISRCQEVFRIIGTLENGQCSRRLPRETRTELQLAVEVIAMKIERQEMRGKRQVPLWYAPEGLARP